MGQGQSQARCGCPADGHPCAPLWACSGRDGGPGREKQGGPGGLPGTAGRGGLGTGPQPRLLTPTAVFAPSYGRVYAAADPYHHTIGPAATYSIGTMVRAAPTAFLCFPARAAASPGRGAWHGGPGSLRGAGAAEGRGAAPHAGGPWEGEPGAGSGGRSSAAPAWLCPGAGRRGAPPPRYTQPEAAPRSRPRTPLPRARLPPAPAA